MVDPVGVDDAIDLVGPADDPERTNSCRMPTLKFAAEGMPDPVRLSDQPPEADLDDGSDGAG